MRAWALTARKDYEAALRDLKRLSAETYKQQPALNADLFICQVSAKDWAAARPLVKLIPKGDQSRPDVVAALKKLPKCEVLLVRRDLARAEQNKKELDAVAAGLTKARAGMLEPQEVGGASLSLCVDSEQDSGRELVATVRVTGPGLVAYGWNRGRMATKLVEREEEISVPLAGRHGRVAFSIRTLAGGNAEITSAVVK